MYDYTAKLSCQSVIFDNAVGNEVGEISYCTSKRQIRKK